MIFSIPARIISLLCAFLYPAYETFKTLANRPGYEQQSSRWLMYWAVMAFVSGFEYSVEFLISWFPFYHEFKMLFLIFLVLPQTQGSTLIYQQFILPVFLQNEKAIDQQLASLHTRVFAVVQDQLQRVLFAAFGWKAAEAANDAQQGPRGVPALGGQRPRMGQSTPSSAGIPTDGGPAGAAGQAAQDIWTKYGPGVMATGANILNRYGANQATQRGAPAEASNSAGAGYGENMSFPEPQVRPAMVPLPPSTTSIPGQPTPFYPMGRNDSGR